MNFNVVPKKVRRRICEWNEHEQCYIHSHDEDIVVPELRKVSEDAGLVLDVEGIDITLQEQDTKLLTNNFETENNND